MSREGIESGPHSQRPSFVSSSCRCETGFLEGQERFEKGAAHAAAPVLEVIGAMVARGLVLGVHRLWQLASRYCSLKHRKLKFEVHSSQPPDAPVVGCRGGTKHAGSFPKNSCTSVATYDFDACQTWVSHSSPCARFIPVLLLSAEAWGRGWAEILWHQCSHPQTLPGNYLEASRNLRQAYSPPESRPRHTQVPVPILSSPSLGGGCTTASRPPCD